MKKKIVYLIRGGFRILDNQNIEPIKIEINGVSFRKGLNGKEICSEKFFLGKY